MPITVELFGIARARAGVDRTATAGGNLGEVLAELAHRYPALGQTCIEGRDLRAGFIVNIGADRFVTSPETPLKDGDTVLLMSLDAGG